MKVHSSLAAAVVAALAFSTPSQAQTAAACVDANSGLPINNGGSIVNNSVACGSGAATTARGGIAIGYMPAFAGAFAPDSTAIGTNALTQGQDAIAIGTNATSNFANAITFGANTATTQANQVVVLGNNAVTSYAPADFRRLRVRRLTAWLPLTLPAI